MRKDRGSRTKKQWNQRKNLKCVGRGPWLSLLPQTVETLQVRQRDVSLRCHCDFWPFSLAQESESHLCPLHYLRREKRQEKRKRRKFYIYPDVTHTHNVPWQCISVYICIYVCMYMYIYTYTNIYIYMYLWYILYTCIYIWEICKYDEIHDDISNNTIPSWSRSIPDDFPTPETVVTSTIHASLTTQLPSLLQAMRQAWRWPGVPKHGRFCQPKWWIMVDLIPKFYPP